jgi:hypothetical protein
MTTPPPGFTSRCPLYTQNAHALVARWLSTAAGEQCHSQVTATLARCADELEAVLARDLAAHQAGPNG